MPIRKAVWGSTVNQQLEMHRHPMPRPEELMRRLSGGYYFTKIDLADVYNQIKLAPESQRKLALSTHRGILLQTCLPFGISTTPGSFQEAAHYSDLRRVALYLDDLLVTGAIAKKHLQNLQVLLKHLQDNGLYAAIWRSVPHQVISGVSGPYTVM